MRATISYSLRVQTATQTFCITFNLVICLSAVVVMIFAIASFYSRRTKIITISLLFQKTTFKYLFEIQMLFFFSFLKMFILLSNAQKQHVHLKYHKWACRYSVGITCAQKISDARKIRSCFAKLNWTFPHDYGCYDRFFQCISRFFYAIHPF